MIRTLAVLALALAVAGCSAGVRTRYRGAAPPSCGGVRPYRPALAVVPCAERLP